ncbi:hypothetical protein [Pseudoalteromonas obscura]|uniref:Uncharacterized protein n=1 Tax=Pseudoalteromonas obscura TaxID=3048491 RepID=A0ABT7EQK0_9GAMM|nr:hypothetical protein [Pseudoalteromonas sp. P94(2023)]MDK2597245.1 hypothetical protein [Pseudoalteromonas sp. P94(2023)]
MSQMPEMELYDFIALRGFHLSVFCIAIYFAFVAKKKGIAFLYDKRFKLDSDYNIKQVSYWITFGVIFVFHFSFDKINYAIITADLDYMFRRRLFYLVRVWIVLVFLASIYALHSLRGCPFSQTTRMIFYITISVATLSFVQLILRGYLHTDIFSPVYRGVTAVHNVLISITLLSYPAKELYQSYRIRVG